MMSADTRAVSPGRAVPRISRRRFFGLVAGGLLAVLARPMGLRAGPAPVRRICFGSCAEQDKPQPIWDHIVAREPDLFVFLGDNIYADTRDMDAMRAQYRMLAAKPGFRRLRESTPVLATWDDHDYGENNAGAGYPMKWQSKQIFLDFFGEPGNSERRWRHGGIYTSYLYGPVGERVQIILPDTRFDRSPLRRLGGAGPFLRKLVGRGPFVPDDDPDKRMLGEAQWTWLEGQLRVPAELRIIATSTPFLMDFPGSESWANLPRERERLIGVVATTGAKGVLFISGDIHRAELSRRVDAVPYPLWELTSSGLTKSWPLVSPNKNRVGEPYRWSNFGMIEIDWQRRDPEVSLNALSRRGRVVINQTVRLSELA